MTTEPRNTETTSMTQSGNLHNREQESSSPGNVSLSLHDSLTSSVTYGASETTSTSAGTPMSDGETTDVTSASEISTLRADSTETTQSSLVISITTMGQTRVTADGSNPQPASTETNVTSSGETSTVSSVSVRGGDGRAGVTFSTAAGDGTLGANKDNDDGIAVTTTEDVLIESTEQPRTTIMRTDEQRGLHTATFGKQTMTTTVSTIVEIILSNVADKTVITPPHRDTSATVTTVNSVTESDTGAASTVDDTVRARNVSAEYTVASVDPDTDAVASVVLDTATPSAGSDRVVRTTTKQTVTSSMDTGPAVTVTADGKRTEVAGDTATVSLDDKSLTTVTLTASTSVDMDTTLPAATATSLATTASSTSVDVDNVATANDTFTAAAFDTAAKGQNTGTTETSSRQQLNTTLTEITETNFVESTENGDLTS